MKKISEQDINNAFSTLDASGPNRFDRLFEVMDKEQPMIVDYLFDAEEDGFNDDERDMLINVSVIAWHIIKGVVGCDSKIPDDYIDGQLDRNVSFFDESDVDIDNIDEKFYTSFSKFNMQNELMEFLIGLVLDRPADYAGNIRHELELIILLHLKTVVDCLVLYKHN